MCNDPVSKIYLSEILLPFDAIVMDLFDNVEGKHNQCAMGSLYNSATLFKAAYNNEKTLLTHGDMRKGMRDILSCVTQE